MAAAAREMARPEAAETIARDALSLADRYRTG
jgi:UDP-N-acetylglucosamine--N-acetylmuramyl-(pentapeptide) pyrophosphoryl-undecaprenol N-acetylglucosamine transferase